MAKTAILYADRSCSTIHVTDFQTWGPLASRANSLPHYRMGWLVPQGTTAICVTDFQTWGPLSSKAKTLPCCCMGLLVPLGTVSQTFRHGDILYPEGKNSTMLFYGLACTTGCYKCMGWHIPKPFRLNFIGLPKRVNWGKPKA